MTKVAKKLAGVDPESPRDLALPDLLPGRQKGVRSRKRFLERLAQFKAAVRTNPRDPEAHTNLGRSFFEKEDFLSAIAHFTKAIEIDTKIVQAHMFRGMAYSLEGEFSNAIRDFEKVIELASEFDTLDHQHKYIATFLVEKARCLYELGRHDEALATCDEVYLKFNTSVNSGAYGDLATRTIRFDVIRSMVIKAASLSRLQRYDQAIAVCDDAVARFEIAHDPASCSSIIEALDVKLYIFLSDNFGDQLKGQLDVCNDVIRLFGDNSDKYLREKVAEAFSRKIFLASHYGAEGAIDACDAFLRKFDASTEPFFREMVAKCLVDKGTWLRKLGRTDEAIEVCNVILRKFGTSDQETLAQCATKAHLLKQILVEDNRLTIYSSSQNEAGRVAGGTETSAVQEVKDARQEISNDQILDALSKRGVGADYQGCGVRLHALR